MATGGGRWVVKKSSRAPLTVVVIDDDDDVRSAIEGLVRAVGYPVRSFQSSSEFLTWPGNYATECIITDVRMPGMTGIDLQTELATRGQDVPMIFITAYPESHVRERVLAAGAICFLTKPFSSVCLLECLRIAMSKPSRLGE
jgi:FixJ family two-component response regulator